MLNDLHFLAINNLGEFQLGADLLFWYYYTQAFKPIILKDRYIPSLRYHQPQAKKGNRKRSAFAIYPGWEIVDEQYEADIHEYSAGMPLACVSGFASIPETPQFYDPETLLRHFSECILTDIVANTPSTAKFQKQLAGTLLEKCLDADRFNLPGINDTALEEYQQWQTWRHKIGHTQDAIAFHLYFQLQTPAKADEVWQLEFIVAPKSDPSLKLLAAK